jgi:hypothetical protein
MDALKEYNKRKGMWCVPRKGTPEHAEVIALMRSMKAAQQPLPESPPPEEQIITTAQMSASKALARKVRLRKLRDLLKAALEKKRDPGHFIF